MRGELRMSVRQYAFAKIDFHAAFSMLDNEDPEDAELKESIQAYIEECDEKIKEQEKAEKEEPASGFTEDGIKNPPEKNGPVPPSSAQSPPDPSW